MNIKPIRNDDALRVAFARLEAIFQAPEGSPEADLCNIRIIANCGAIWPKSSEK